MEAEQLLDRKQLAAILGLKPRGVDGLVKRKVITCFRLGRKCLRFRLSDVQADLQRVQVLSVGAKAEQRKAQQARGFTGRR
jgi:hypothetical protein